jgi:hypothetical protein
VSNDSLYGFFTFWEEGVIAELAAVEEGFDGSEVCHFSRDNLCPISSTAELEVPFYNTLDMFL